MSKTLHLVQSPSEAPSANCLILEDDVLEALFGEVRENPRYPMSWRLCQDFYGDCRFDPAEAGQLASELATLSSGTAAPFAAWIDAVRVLAARARSAGWSLVAIAD